MADNAFSSDLSSGRNLPAPLAGLARDGVGGILERIGNLAQQPAVAKSLPMLGMLGVLVAAFLAWAVLHQPAQRDLFSGLPDADKASVAQALDTAGIKYHLDSGTGELTVPEDSYYRAKMLLAQQGLPKSAPDGDAMIASLPMGASRAVEGARLEQAQEMDIARTIEAIDAVQAAKVHIAADQPSVFLRDAAKPQASVMLNLRAGRTLSDSQVQAIVHLVASSVAGLSPGDVSVVDQSGRLLSASSGLNGSGADQQVALQNAVEDRYRQTLASLLTPILGDGNFTAEVHADLDFAQVASTQETYPKDSGVIASEQGEWSNNQDNNGKGASGIPGALSNTAPTPAQTTPNATPQNGPAAPGTAPGQASAAATQKTNESYNRAYQLGHQVSVTQNATGTVRRLSVAVALRQAPGAKPLTAQQQTQIQNLIKGAVGFDQARGDVVAVTSQPFIAVDQLAGPKWYEASWIATVGRNVTALLVAALLVFGIGRPLMKRRAASAEQSAEGAADRRGRQNLAVGKELAAALTHHEVQSSLSGERPVSLDMIKNASGYEARAALMRQFVRQDPDRAALVVRDLIRGDMQKAAPVSG